MRALTLLVAAAFFAALLAVRVASAAEPQIHKGAVISAGDGRLVLRDASGKEQTHLVSKETKITINGRIGRLEELTPTTLVRVTTEGSDKVFSIATIDDDKHFPAD
jgi:hypothetical protein